MTARDEWLAVESLDLEAQGVAHDAEGKVVFIEGALPGEQVQVAVHRRKNNWEQASVTALRRESAQRVAPRCRFFGVCGGCKMQHFHVGAQIAVKQRVLEDNLWHLAKVRPERMLRPIEGPTWGYRHRARLSVRHVPKKGGVLVGFHERKSSYVADMTSCEILPPHVSALLVPLRALIAAMDARDRLPQIELAIGSAGPATVAATLPRAGGTAAADESAPPAADESAPPAGHETEALPGGIGRPAGRVTALVLRHLEPLGEADLARLSDFARLHGVQWWLQPKGPDSAHPLDPRDARLAYALPEFGIVMPFRPTDFTQVNHAINEALVGRALRLLEPRPEERVIDWFCGLGNFTLPIATRAGAVLGLEGSEALLARARENAAANRLAARTRFEARNLFELAPADLARYESAAKWLVDPPREGAFALAKAVADAVQDPALAPGWEPPARIVYVSCNPATLARDACLLVHQAGYRCTAAGAVNMFPHTAHVESIAVFERG